MKFLRKVAVLVIAMVCVAAFAIGIGVIYSVRNVNIIMLSYEDKEASENNIAAVRQAVSGKCMGSVIAFVDEENVISAIDDGYTVEKFEKVYPCTINITVKQRMDVFAVQKGENFEIYDEDGVYLYTSENADNSFDSSPNVLVSGVETKEEMATIAKVSSVFKDKFASLRSVVESISLNKAKSSIDSDRIVFELRCGVVIELQDYENFTSEKISEAFRTFSSLTGEQKLTVRIYAYEVDGAVKATYSDNK